MFYFNQINNTNNILLFDLTNNYLFYLIRKSNNIQNEKFSFIKFCRLWKLVINLIYNFKKTFKLIV